LEVIELSLNEEKLKQYLISSAVVGFLDGHNLIMPSQYTEPKNRLLIVPLSSQMPGLYMDHSISTHCSLWTDISWPSLVLL